MTDNGQIHEQIAKYLSGEALPEEAVQVEDWARSSVENESFLHDCFRIYTTPGQADPEAMKTAIWQTIEAKIKTTPRPSAGKRILWPAGIAASVLVVLLAGWLLIRKDGKAAAPLLYQTFAASRLILLSDSTRVDMAPYSSLEVAPSYGEKNRTVTLKGSASFSVRHDEGSPFLVRTGPLTVRDLGTRFSITAPAGSDLTHIAVEEGSVEVADGTGQVRNLEAGEAAYYRQSSRTFLPGRPAAAGSPRTERSRTTPIHPPSPASAPGGSDTARPSGDIVLNLTLAEAQQVLGGRAALVNNDQNKNNGLLRHTRLFRSPADALMELTSTVEYFKDAAAAAEAYERVRTGFAAAKTPPDFTAAGANAFYIRDGERFYLLLLQKRNAVFRLRVAPLKKGFSVEAAVRAAHRIAKEIP